MVRHVKEVDVFLEGPVRGAKSECPAVASFWGRSILDFILCPSYVRWDDNQYM